MTASPGVLKIKIKRVHFVGIGGIGMSGIAEILCSQGFAITGSDQKDSPLCDRLRSLGIPVAVGHKAQNVGGADVVVYSSAIPRDNPELLLAREHGIPVIPRAEILSELMRMKEGIAIAGTHGKTTTTSMVAWILSEAGLDPTCLVGGRLEQFDSNARKGSGSLLVTEADESDGTFLKLTPVMNVVTNIDPEHLDYWGSFGKLVDAFERFCNLVPFYGMNVVCIDHEVVRAILPRLTRRTATYGFSEDADFRAADVQIEGLGSRFSILKDNEPLGEVKIRLPGRHNVLNALAATACALELEVPFRVIAEALASFRGVDRRFQIKGVSQGVTVVDDYGHHPTEIRATLKAARDAYHGKVVVLFQPHRFSRVKDLFYEFARSFSDADRVYVTDIYAASETPIPGVNSESLCAAICEAGHPATEYFADKFEAAKAAERELGDGDVFIALGAGDVKNAAPVLLDILRARDVQGRQA